VVATGLKKALFTGAFLVSALLAAAVNAAVPATDKIRHVIDGDTLVLASGRHVRLIGINAPEPGKNGTPDQPLAAKARQRLAALVEQRRVTLVFETERQDHYGRQLAHVLLPDGTSAGEILLREGLAWAVAIPPNLGNLKAGLAAENEARGARRGVWSQPAYAPKPADKLTAADTGFGFIEGTILRHKRGKHVIYFDLAPTVALQVSNVDWKKYFDGPPSALVGRKAVARGWLTQSRGRLHLRVPHPAMLTWLD
jgi:endonuclease YncB( thermonuclease family)